MAIHNSATICIAGPVLCFGPCTESALLGTMDAPGAIRVVLSTIIEQEAQAGEFALVVEVGEIFTVLGVKYLAEIMAGGYIVNIGLDIHKVGTGHVTFSV